MEALGGQGGGSIIILILIFAVMYFVMIRPQRKRQKQVEEMRAGVKSGDRITTIGGLRGKVTRVTDESIMIEAGPDRLRLEFMKWAVSKVDEKGAPKSGGGKAEPKAEDTAADEPEPEETEEAKVIKKPKRLGFKQPDAGEEDKESEE